MKLKNCFLLAALSIFLLNCNSDDDSNTSSDITPNVTIDINGILALPAGSDITSLVTFEGANPFDYLAELEVGQSLRLTQPSGLASGEALLYSRLFFFEENLLDPGVFDIQIDTADVYGAYLNKFIAPPGSVEAFENPNDFNRNISTFLDLTVFDAMDNDDIDYKYDIEVAIREADGSVSDYYYIDPKIRIKSRN
ncbi:MAG: hypothetical protein EVB11_04885 [Winogradskyella sp.]|nr:MAG: hypothetical protein EVB11_04885 [Winogradskyella sp.]